MARDTQGSDPAFNEQTARSYLAALEQLMVVEQQPAWAPHLRSRSRLRTSRKRHFVDPSLATAGLGAGPGRWGAFEIKLGVGRIEDAARTLLTFAERVDKTRCGDPAVLAVVTSTGYGYQRPDGVAVIPVGVLGP